MKSYSKPEIQFEKFDLFDVILASVPTFGENELPMDKWMED